MHLFGYDHMTEEDKKQMRDKEKQALKLLGVEQ
jgi:ssRNA-specific RNase YbeY (16S rRNA maturation enzyme)